MRGFAGSAADILPTRLTLRNGTPYLPATPPPAPVVGLTEKYVSYPYGGNTTLPTAAGDCAQSLQRHMRHDNIAQELA